MAKKNELKTEIKRLKKRNKHQRKIIASGLRTLEERDTRIAQLTSVVDMMHETPKKKNQKDGHSVIQPETHA